MKSFILSLLALCACGDFFQDVAGVSGACGPGLSRDWGPSCAIPEAQIQIDGAFDDWAQASVASMTQCVDCEISGAVFNMDVARDDEALFIRIATNGTPVTETGARYVVQMRRVDMLSSDEGNTTISLLFWESDYVMSFNGNWIRGLDAEYMHAPDGLEIRVPLSSLPFPGGAKMVAYYRAADGTLDRELLLLSKVCWDPDDKDDPCSI